MAQLLLLSTSQALASADGDWLHIALDADQFRQQNDPKRAREIWLKALAKLDSDKNSKEPNPWISIALRNLSELSLQVDDIDSAEKYSIRWVADLEKVDKDFPDMARASLVRGKVFAVRNQFDRSLECLLKANRLAHDTPVDAYDRSEALTFLAADYEVRNDQKNSKRCQKELIDVLTERRGKTAFRLLDDAAAQLENFSKHLPEKGKKSYLRVAHNLYGLMFTERQKLGDMTERTPFILIRMADISTTLGDTKQAYSELLKAKEYCFRNASLQRDQRAHFAATTSQAFLKIDKPIDAAQCLNFAKACCGGKAYTYGWHVNHCAAEASFKSGDYKQAREYFLESLSIAQEPSQHSLTLVRLADCSMHLGNMQESERYLNSAYQEALKLKKSGSPKVQQQIALITGGVAQLLTSYRLGSEAKKAAQVHALYVSLRQGVLTKVVGDYVYQAALDIEAGEISDAIKNLNAGFALAKYSTNQPEILSKNPDTDVVPPDNSRWLYVEHFRLMGLCALYNHDIETAKKQFQQNLSEGEKMKWIVGKNYCKYNNAMFLLQIGALKESRRLFEEVIEFNKAEKTFADFNMTTKFWYAVALCEDRDYAEASKYCQRVIDFREKADGHEKWTAMTDGLRGRIQSLTGHHQEAQALFDKAIVSLSKNRKENSQDLANILYWQLADCLAQNQKAKAKELARTAVPLFEMRNAHCFTYETECRKVLAAK